MPPPLSAPSMASSAAATLLGRGLRSVVGAVSQHEFSACMQRMFNKAPTLKESLMSGKIAVALSGGPDSMALFGLLRGVYPKDRIVAFFVNHNLQSLGVTEDESMVRSAFGHFGVEGKVLNMQWSSGEMNSLSKGQIQEQTRLKRYNMLLEACKEVGAKVLLTGHNQDDDIVTMLYRLGHGSGLDGIGGMKLINPFPIAHYEADCHFVGHPLLDIPKERLLRTCEQLQLNWNLDRSNTDNDYQRNSILSSLVEMQQTMQGQSQAETLTLGEELVKVLNLFKDIRSDIHQQLMSVFANSIFVNRVIGDATMIVNNRNGDLLKNPPVINRAIGTVTQYVAARFLPVRTKRMLEVQRTLKDALTAHQDELNKKESMLHARGTLSTNGSDRMLAYDKAKRADVAQMTVGGATIYALSRADAMRRTTLISRMCHRSLDSGPAFLIQREPPTRIDNQKAAFKAEKVELKPGQVHLWDDRIYLQYDGGLETDELRTFAISYLTMADVREFERLTAGCNSLIRRQLYSYLGTTPGTHLYQIPVIREVANGSASTGTPSDTGKASTSSVTSGYIAFPTLRLQYPVDKYQWTTKQAGNSVLVSKIQCLP